MIVATLARMRLNPLGRPDPGAFAGLFDIPAPGAGLSVTFLGVATLLLDDGRTQVLTDGFFTRPGLLKVAFGKVAPDPALVRTCLSRAAISRLAMVAPVHSHYDHALDSAVVAAQTGALLVGGESTANVGRGGKLPEAQIRVVRSGEDIRAGDFTLTFIASRHSEPDRFPGVITEPVVPPARAARYKCGEAWSIIARHAGGHSLLIHGSAGYVEGALRGHHADVAYLGTGQLGKQDDGFIERYWQHTVRTAGARRVVLIHWDNFFDPAGRPARALPYLVDDLGRVVRILTRLAAADRITLNLPTPFAPANPWHGL